MTTEKAPIVILSFCIFILVPFMSNVWGATYYVAPSREVPIRTGTDFSKKIVAVLKDGTKVELLNEQDAWAYIRTPKGKEGWILKRYLTPNLPPKLQLERLRSKNEKLQNELKRLKEELKACSTKGGGCEKELSACIAEREKLESDFKALKHDAAHVIETKKLLMETQKALEEANADRIKLKQQLNSLKANTNIKWFLSGGGVLLLGWILGLISNRRRKRRPSLL